MYRRTGAHETGAAGDGEAVAVPVTKTIIRGRVILEPFLEAPED